VAVFVKKNTKKYEYKMGYESEHLFRAPPRGLEEAWKGPVQVKGLEA
jgi:hypothetical protein